MDLKGGEYLEENSLVESQPAQKVLSMKAYQMESHCMLRVGASLGWSFPNPALHQDHLRSI